MKFLELPRRLQAYILLHVLGLFPIAYLVWHQPGPGSGWFLGGLVLFTILFSTWRVELPVFQAKMTLTFGMVCLALLNQGLAAAVLCTSLGALVGTFVRPGKKRFRLELVRMPLYRGLFNIANCAISCTTSALVYNLVLKAAAGREMAPVLALNAFTVFYFLINTLGVSHAVALQRGTSWLLVWKENFRWTAPGSFAGASVALAIHATYQHLGAWSITLLPWIYIIYYFYRLYMERTRQDMAHIQELNRLNQAIIASLAAAIDAKDRDTSSHVNRVQHYAIALARAAGIAGLELEAVATGALVHDIGKLGIPDHILLKPGKLTPDEFRRMQTHVAIGAEILSPVPFSYPVRDVVLSHHERWDGLGYPNGLKEEAIPMGGRIISIVDVFDALTSNRPYRRAKSPEEALQVLLEGAGKQFDPRLVDLFVKILPQVRQEIEEMERDEKVKAEAASVSEESGSGLIRINQAAAEMAAVCDVALSLAEQESLEGILRVVVARALALMPADTAVLYLKSPEGTMMVARGVDGKYREKLEGMAIQIGEGVCGCVAENRQPRVNVSAALDVARRFTPEENMELSTATAVPLVQGSETIGVLAVYTTAYNLLSEHHLNLLSILSEHASVAIQNLRRLEQHRDLAYTDPLTGLSNSRCLFRSLDRLLNREGSSGADETSFCVMMLDLDGFKEINDRLGHLRGDDFLRSTAETLLETSRPQDMVCRYAGDEFVVLLPGSDRQGGEQAARRLRSAIEELDLFEGQVRVGVSVGVAAFPQDGADGRELINVADRRMYEDKFERRQGSSSQRPSSVPPRIKVA